MSPRLRRGLTHPPACERRLPVGVPPLDQRLLPHPASGGPCLPALGPPGQVLLAFDPALVEEWGCLGIDRAAARSEARGKHGWTELLVDHPGPPGAMYSELFADWIRLSGLMDYAVGLFGLQHDHAAIGALVEVLRAPA